MFPRSARRPLTGRIEEFFRGAIARWLIRRYVKKGKKLTEPTLTPNQQIDALQRQIAALRAMQVAHPNISLADQLAAIPSPSLVTPSQVEQIAANGALPVVVPAEPAPAPEPQAVTPLPQLEPEPAMETPAQQAAPTAVAAVPAAAPSTGSSLPDVKMLAPILKIALAVLTIEQMVEIGLHVKMGAPGFQQFLDSEVAKTKFRELYTTYCDFLAGKIK